MTITERVMAYHAHDTEVTTRWDRGRKLISVIKLAAGGAIGAASIVGIAAAASGHPTTEVVDALVGAVAGIATFIFLSRAFHIFGVQPK